MDPYMELLATRRAPLGNDVDEGDDEEAEDFFAGSFRDSLTLVNTRSSMISLQSTTLTQREHALLELLSSERAYASDLALVRDVHLPAALGLTILPLSNPLAGPPSSSTVPPMTPGDIHIIFSNIIEIAMFADMVTEQLEVALGAILDGGTSRDSVGQLFLWIAPAMERPYKQYITRHTSALRHLRHLPKTPALQNYLTYITQNVSSCDLASFLIKPVERLLKYPLLLTAIIDETPDRHPDKENLRAARIIMEEAARNFDEERRQVEGENTSAVGVATSSAVNISKTMSIRPGGVTATTIRVSKLTDEINNEADLVDALHSEVMKIEHFGQNFAKSVVEWSKMTSNTTLALRTWSHSFANVILSSGVQSEAFDAFLDVLEKGISPLLSDMDEAINNRVLKDIARLLASMSQPLKLVQSLSELEFYHYRFLATPVTMRKRRPPSDLLTASSDYLALRGQLAAELPTYIRLLKKAFGPIVLRFADIQSRFWAGVRVSWDQLWEALRAETEVNPGREETCAVWRSRWEAVDQSLSGLTILTPVQEVITGFLRVKELREKELREKERGMIVDKLRRQEMLAYPKIATLHNRLPSHVLPSLDSIKHDISRHRHQDSSYARSELPPAMNSSSQRGPPKSAKSHLKDSSYATSEPPPLTLTQRDSWVSKPAKYLCRVVHPCKPPASVSYYSFPFFTLREGDIYEVLQEAGHPSTHLKLPLYVDDGEDCLLLCRDSKSSIVGWALASFLEPTAPLD